MAWLEGDARNIASGWAPEPSLSAPPIGEVLKSILANRLAQQALTQSTISDAIKAQQSRNQDSAFAQALQNTGLSEGQDFSGLSGAQMARMTQLLADRTPDTQHDALLAAQTAEANARAGMFNKYPGTGGGGDGGPEIVEQDGIKYLVNRTSKSVTYHRLPGQGGPKLTPTEQGWAAPEIPGVTVYPDNTADPLAPDTPSMPDPNTQNQTGQPQTNNGGVDILKERQAAQDAIASGKDPDAVKQRFHDRTGGVF